MSRMTIAIDYVSMIMLSEYGAVQKKNEGCGYEQRKAALLFLSW